MPYQHCRWFDVYPNLAYAIRLLTLMPSEKQAWIGEGLAVYLDNRNIVSSPGVTSQRGNRPYDSVDTIYTSLERLKSAPAAVKIQTADYLLMLLSQSQARRFQASKVS